MEIKTKFNHGERVQAITFAQESFKEECPVCEGKGRFTYKNSQIECQEPSCWGTGYVTKTHPEKWFVPKDPYFNFVIQRIGIELYNPNNKKVSDNKSWIYYMSGSSGSMFDEKNVFASTKEAQEECDKRNSLR